MDSCTLEEGDAVSFARGSQRAAAPAPGATHTHPYSHPTCSSRRMNSAVWGWSSWLFCRWIGLILNHSCWACSDEVIAVRRGDVCKPKTTVAAVEVRK